MTRAQPTIEALFQLHVLPTDAWAERVAAELIERLRARPDLRLCLATGDTPSPVYARLADAARAGEVSLADATVVVLDEYVGLAADDPARSDNRLGRELIDRLPVPPANYFPIRVDELPPDEAAAVHDAVGASGVDLALVGIGLNGHVGFNEPGSTAASGTRVVHLDERSTSVATSVYGATDTPRQGITLGLARLLEAREVWLLATGARKADVLARALRGPESPACPASYLRRHSRLSVFADESAAAGLEQEDDHG